MRGTTTTKPRSRRTFQTVAEPEAPTKRTMRRGERNTPIKFPMVELITAPASSPPPFFCNVWSDKSQSRSAGALEKQRGKEAKKARVPTW